MEFNYEAFGNDTKKLVSVGGKPLNPNATLNPCGKIARFHFNDRFEVYSYKDRKYSPITVNETGIAYQSDKEVSFKRAPNYLDVQWIDVQNEHFMVWMNMEVFPDFDKKWGIINQDLPAGEYIIRIEYNWDFSSANVGKEIILSSAEGFGAASFLGWSMIKAAVVTFFSIALLILAGATRKNKFDEQDLVWD